MFYIAKRTCFWEDAATGWGLGRRRRRQRWRRWRYRRKKRKNKSKGEENTKGSLWRKKGRKCPSDSCRGGGERAHRRPSSFGGARPPPLRRPFSRPRALGRARRRTSGPPGAAARRRRWPRWRTAQRWPRLERKKVRRPKTCRRRFRRRRSRGCRCPSSAPDGVWRGGGRFCGARVRSRCCTIVYSFVAMKIGKVENGMEEVRVGTMADWMVVGWRERQWNCGGNSVT